MPKEFDDIKVEELKETFGMFDKDSDGFLDLAEFRKTIRSTGLNPSEDDFIAMKKIAAIEKTVNFKQFLAVMKADIRKMDREEDLLRAFYVFDESNTGQIDSKMLKDCLKNMGEPVNDEEFMKFTKFSLPDMNGNIDYKKLTEFLFRTKPG